MSYAFYNALSAAENTDFTVFHRLRPRLTSMPLCQDEERSIKSAPHLRHRIISIIANVALTLKNNWAQANAVWRPHGSLRPLPAYSLFEPARS